MNEQISLNGAPVVGFGDEASEKKQLATVLGTPTVGFVVGVVGGAVLGHLIKEGVGTVAGAIVGGIGGTIGGIALASESDAPAGAHTTPAPALPAPSPQAAPPPPSPSLPPPVLVPTPTTTTAWQQVQANSTIKAGQRIAIAVAEVNGVPLPPEFIAQGNRVFAAAAAAQPELNAVMYPPGSILPLDWPSDDDFGPNAYRYMVNAPVTAPLTSLAEIPTAGIPEMGALMTFKAWVRYES